MEPGTSFGGILLLAAKHQLSVVAITQTLVVAGVTASVTTYATAQRVDERMKEAVQEIKEIKQEHTMMRERITVIETQLKTHTAQNGLRPERN